MAELGKAYIEVRADLAKFPAELRAKLVAALKDGLKGVEFDELGKKAEAAGEEAADRAGKGFAKKGKAAFDKAAKEAGKGLLSRLIGFFDGRRSNDKGSLFGSISGAVSGGISDGLKGAQSAFQTIGTIGSNIGGAFAKIGDIGGEVGSVLKIAAFTVLIPIVIGLAGALFQLSAALFALPAAIGVVLAIAAPLMIAFQGIGEAVSAGLSGDTKAFDAALKGLAPSARSVVKEIVGLGPALKAIKSNVQGAFFAPLVGDFRVLGKTLLPVLNGGLTLVAHSLGRFVSGLLGILAGKEALATLSSLFQTTARIVERMGPTLQNLFADMLGLVKTGLPFVERFFGWIASGVDTFALWLEKAQKGGQVTAWLERAADIGKKLWEVLKQVGIFAVTVLNSLGDEGTDTLKGLGDALKELNAYFKSKEGQEWLHNVGVLVHWAGNALVFFIKSLVGSFNALNWTFDAVRWLAKALESLGGAVWSAIKAIGRFFAAVGGWLADAGRAIGRFFTETIPRWFGQLVDWFQALPGKIISGLQDVARGIGGWLLELQANILRGIGVVIGLFLAFPGQVWAVLQALPGLIASIWTTAWEWTKGAVKTGFDAVIAFFVAIPGALAAAGEAIWTWASDLWGRVWGTTYALITEGWDKAWTFITSIPGKIAGLGPKILEAARGIGRKIGDGLSEIGNFATDLGKKVTDALKGSINWVIDRINEGINAVDEKIPGGLPRIPRLAKGAVVDRPTLAVIGEAGREVVMPLNDPARARELAEQSGLVNLLQSGRPSSSVNVTVYLDPSGVIVPITRTVVNDALDHQGAELAYGTRDA